MTVRLLQLNSRVANFLIRIELFYFCFKPECFTFSGSSVLDCWPLTRSVQDTLHVPQTHDRPISHVSMNVQSFRRISATRTKMISTAWFSLGIKDAWR